MFSSADAISIMQRSHQTLDLLHIQLGHSESISIPLQPVGRISRRRNPPLTCDRSAGYAAPTRPTRQGLLRLSQNCYIFTMTTAEDIEKAIEQLPPQELARLRAWFEAFDAQQFDAAVERDARAGKLDALADEALAAHRAGRSREL